MSRTLKITPTESVTITRARTSTSRCSRAASGSGPGDEGRTLGVGDEIDIPCGTVHKMWNPGSGDAGVLWQTRPAGRTEEWFAAIDRLHREGKAGRNGMPGRLAFAALLTEYDDVFRLAAGPEPVVRGALAGAARPHAWLRAALGQAQGHSE